MFLVTVNLTKYNNVINDQMTKVTGQIDSYQIHCSLVKNKLKKHPLALIYYFSVIGFFFNSHITLYSKVTLILDIP